MPDLIQFLNPYIGPAVLAGMGGVLSALGWVIREIRSAAKEYRTSQAEQNRLLAIITTDLEGLKEFKSDSKNHLGQLVHKQDEHGKLLHEHGSRITGLEHTIGHKPQPHLS